MEHFSLSEWLQAAFYSAIASFGGLLGYIMREHDRGNDLTLGRALVEAASSGFVGFLVMLLCRAMGLDLLWSGFLVGLCGWLGATASIRILERVVYDKLGIKRDKEDDQ